MEEVEQVSNGGMLYHEVQESNLCAVHCVNTVLQGPFFSEIDLAALASDLDQSEREVFHPKDDQQQQQGSHNVSLRGDFSIQLLGRRHFRLTTNVALRGNIGQRMEVELNGGMLYLYHEIQESHLCGLHCVNTVLQGPLFSEIDLAALALDLDRLEREVFFPQDEQQGSHNVSLRGDFSIQVLQKAMEVWDLQVIQLNSPEAESAQVHPELENAFICHLQDHWFCIRKVNGEWYNFNSLYPAPEHLSKFYLSAYLATLKSSGWSIFIVKGNFPRECPITLSEGSNGFGQWLLPEDAERMTKAFNDKQSQRQPQIQRSDATEEFVNPFGTYNEDDDEDLNAAIAASLMDSTNNSFKGSSSTIGIAGAAMTQNETKRGSMTELLTSKDSDEDLRAAIAASLMDSENKSLAGSSSTSVTAEAATSQDGKDVQKTIEE